MYRRTTTCFSLLCSPELQDDGWFFFSSSFIHLFHFPLFSSSFFVFDILRLTLFFFFFFHSTKSFNVKLGRHRLKGLLCWVAPFVAPLKNFPSLFIVSCVCTYILLIHTKVSRKRKADYNVLTKHFERSFKIRNPVGHLKKFVFSFYRLLCICLCLFLMRT